MWEAEVIRAANQVHSCLQRIKALSRMPTFSGERSQTLTHRPIEAFDEGGIELIASSSHLEELLCFLQCSSRYLACDLYHPFLFRVFDHRRDTQIRPHL